MNLAERYALKYSVRDPIHGPIPFTAVEKEIIDSLHFQRLRNIVQNSMCYRVFPGARHTRFEHSIGVMHLAGRLFDTLNRASKPFISFSDAYGLDENQTLKLWQTFRLGSLLHDIGHGPFSHAAEDLPTAKHHETWSLEFIVSDPIKSIIEKHKLDPELVQLVAVEAKDPPIGPMNLTKRTLPIIRLNQLLTGELGVDRMDYLLRDSYYCGVRYGMFEVERLIESMHLLRVKAEAGSETKSKGRGKKGSKGKEKDDILLVLGSDGVSAVEALTFARFQMFSSVYFHKTVTILNWHLNKFVESQLQGRKYPQALAKYALYDDSAVQVAMNEAAQGRASKAKDHAVALLQRRHHRMAWETTNEVIGRLKMENPDELIQEHLKLHGFNNDEDYVYRQGTSKGQSYSSSKLWVYQNHGVKNFSVSAPIASAIPKIKFARVYVPENSTRKEELRNVLNAWEASHIKAHPKD